MIDDEDLAEMIDLPWDILFCEAAIPLLSSEDEKSAEASFEYCVEYRRLLSASIASMNAMFPPKEMPSWTDRAFIEAHSFIRDAYPIAEKISEYTPLSSMMKSITAASLKFINTLIPMKFRKTRYFRLANSERR